MNVQRINANAQRNMAAKIRTSTAIEKTCRCQCGMKYSIPLRDEQNGWGQFYNKQHKRNWIESQKSL